MNKKILPVVFLLMSITLFGSCGSRQKKSVEQDVSQVETPKFNSDSAWHYTEAQTLFGPRVPNTKAHELCREYLFQSLKKAGATVTEQKADLKAYDGTILKSTNIIASFFPERTNRILLCSHWDSRPWADQDPNKDNWHKPIPGANDGASGVGVLLEIARQIGNEISKKGNVPNVGIDIIFFDSEDYGCPEFYQGKKDEDSWCLGTQYWARNPHKKGYTAKYGILLDMVGGSSAHFGWEVFSEKYAQSVLDNVWSKASSLGYGNYFVSSEGGAITDDHLYINRLASIPCIDIIDCSPGSVTGFVPYWHTLDDNMQNIDKSTLNAVGTTLLQVIYSE